MKRLITGLVFATACLNLFAAEGRWTEGFGQGNFEYFIDQNGVQIYIGCPSAAGSVDLKSDVSIIDNGSSVENFTIVVNGISYEGPFSADSRVGDNNFLSLLDSLRKADAEVNFNGKTIKFPKSNAAEVIPASLADLSCNLSSS